MGGRHSSPAISRRRRLPAESALYPADPAGRAAARRDIRDRVMADAERRAGELGRSMKCSGWGGIASPRHTGAEDGCASDGSYCVCECHDAEEVPDVG